MSLKSRSGMRLANQGSIGFFSNRLRALRRNSRIQGASLLMSDISRTMASLMPFLGLKTGICSSDQPNWYRLKSRLSIATALLWDLPYGHSSNSCARARAGWQSGAVPTPPRAPRRPHASTCHGDTRIDPYYWLMDRDLEEVRAHLEAENEYLAQALADQAPLTELLYEEIKARIEETDISVPVRDRGWWYFERTREGLNYPISCRVPADPHDATPPTVDPHGDLPHEQVILDENLEAAGRDFLSVGVLAVSPDDAWVAVGTDFEGDERHRVTFRPLAGQSAIDDVLVYQEDDAQFTVSLGRSRDDAVIVVLVGSSMTTEVRYLAADSPTGELAVLEARRHGVEYGVEHFTDAAGRRWWLKVTNEDATDFRLLARPCGASSSRPSSPRVWPPTSSWPPARSSCASARSCATASASRSRWWRAATLSRSVPTGSCAPASPPRS